jgi:hypothetical protein
MRDHRPEGPATATGQEPPDERLRRLWATGRGPDVAAFLAEAAPQPPGDYPAVASLPPSPGWV